MLLEKMHRLSYNGGQFMAKETRVLIDTPCI